MAGSALGIHDLTMDAAGLYETVDFREPRLDHDEYDQERGRGSLRVEESGDWCV